MSGQAICLSIAALDGFMTGLNPAQADAVSTLSGPLLVLAGAGTGKTRVITFRIAKLIQSGIAPQKILGVTFTNKAATEMQERLDLILGRRGENRPFISTFHSLCVRILRRHIEALGYPARFTIYNRGDQEALARSVLREIKVSDTLLSPAQLLYIIGDWKNRSLGPDQAVMECDTDRDHLAGGRARELSHPPLSRARVPTSEIAFELGEERLIVNVPQPHRGRSCPSAAHTSRGGAAPRAQATKRRAGGRIRESAKPCRPPSPRCSR